jgi:hypothetical protein
MNNFLLNAKEVVTNEDVKRWQEKVKLMIGYVLLGNLMSYKKLEISKSFDEKFYIDFNDKKQCVLFSNTYLTTTLWNNLIRNHPLYEMVQDEYIIRVDQGGVLFGLYRLKNEESTSDFILTSNFLYDLYITAICEWQHKNKTKVMKKQISEIVHLCFERQYISFELYKIFSYSRYIDGMYTNMITDHYIDKIESIKDEIFKEMRSYFMDGEEAAQFMNLEI